MDTMVWPPVRSTATPTRRPVPPKGSAEPHVSRRLRDAGWAGSW